MKLLEFLKSKIQLGIDWSLFLIGYSFYLNYVKREEQC